MREKWNEALDKLDEKYINEAAQAHAKHAAAQQEAEQFSAESERPTAMAMSTAKPQKKGIGKIIGVCSAAAAVVAVAIGGGVMLSRDDVLTGYPTNEVTAEATAEYTETAEVPDTPESGDYIIEFSQQYKEGYIEFSGAEKAPWLGQNGIVGSMDELGRGGALDYAEEISGKSLDTLHNTLVKGGYTLDLGIGGSFYNALADEENVNRQVTLVYTNEGAEIIINLGESTDNFDYCRMDGGYRLSTVGEKISTLQSDNGWGVRFDICGMVMNGENYYAVEAESNNWVNDKYNMVYCHVSARGSSTEDIIGVVSSLICGGELTSVELAPLDLADYEVICTKYDVLEYQITEDMHNELSDIVEGFAEGEPLYGIRSMDMLHERLVLYPREGLQDCDTVQLNFGGDEKTYYSLKRDDKLVYYEISEESGNALREWLVKYSPYFINGVITDIAGANKYILTDDKTGRVYIIGCAQELAQGDAVRVWYLNDGSDDMNLNVLELTERYNIKADNSTLIPEGDIFEGYDPEVFREYFLGEWTAIGKDWEIIQTFDFKDGLFGELRCGELSDGYYLAYQYDIEPVFYFVPKDYPDTMYYIRAYDWETMLSIKRSECTYEEYLKTDDGIRWLEGSINQMGEYELCDRMGGNFSEVFDSVLNDTITDWRGIEWKYDDSVGAYNPYVFIKRYAAGTAAFYAEIYLEYRRTDNNETQDYTTQWYTHTIAMDDNGEWVLMASLPCDKNGNRYHRGNLAENPEAGGVGVTAELADYDIRGGICYAEYDEKYMLYPLVYVDSADNKEWLATAQFSNVAFSAHGASPRPKGFVHCVPLDISTKDGPAFAILVPVNTADGMEYYPTLYGYDEENREIVYIAGNEYLPASSVDVFTVDYENGTISYVTVDGAAVSYRLDLVNFALYETESQPEYDVIPVDESKGEEVSDVIFADFFGDWSSDTDTVSFNLYSDMFGYDERCYSYKDEAGSYLMSEGRLWFIPASDRSTMHYFEDMHGENFRSGRADRIYTRNGSPQGFYGGDGEMGWIGVLDMLYNAGRADVDKLFDLEVTDMSGNVWVRNPDTSIDWGGVYSAYIYDVNENLSYFIKMQSKSNPDKFAYVSFLFYGGITDTGELRYADQHYSFDVSVMDTKLLSTDFASQAKETAESEKYGMFVVEPHFYPMENGTYYAVRMMGNNQAQWLVDGELFYNDGSGYRLVRRVDSCSFAVSGDYLFELFNMYYEDYSDYERTLNLWRYHDGYHLADIIVDERGFVRMGAGIQLIEGDPDWLIVGFHHDDMQADVQYFYELSDPENLTSENAKLADTLVSNDDGTTTVFFTDGTQATLMIYV